MVTNQQRADERRADSKLLAETVQHLTHQVQRARSGWTAEPSDDGRYLIGSGSSNFRDTIIETYGPYAETIQNYLLSVDPDHTRLLIALLEDVQRGITTGTVPDSTRKAAVEYAEAILGRTRASARRRPPS
jgi:hypothetical protein